MSDIWKIWRKVLELILILGKENQMPNRNYAPGNGELFTNTLYITGLFSETVQ